MNTIWIRTTPVIIILLYKNSTNLQTNTSPSQTLEHRGHCLVTLFTNSFQQTRLRFPKTVKHQQNTNKKR